MLQPLYGLNQPYNTACTPARTAVSASASFTTGQFVKLTNGKAELAATPADGLGSEIVWEPTGMTWNMQGTIPTIMGTLEAMTDQYNAASTYTDRALLVTRAGVLDVAATDAEKALAIAFCIGGLVNGVLHFKRFAN